MKRERPTPVGELRPSQLLYAFGVGAVVDMPNVSAIVLGLDDWPHHHAAELSERRLLKRVQRMLGGQVERLISPPVPPPATRSWRGPSADEQRIGVPVGGFPRWARCPSCDELMRLDSPRVLLKVDPTRPDRTRYVHQNCRRARQPGVVPARFFVSCEHGHLDDFPWHLFTHRGPAACHSLFELYETGASGAVSDVVVKCRTCGESRRMSDAFGEENRHKHMPMCRGRHPHLKRFDDGCALRMKPILLGASNAWFGVTDTVISIPERDDDLDRLVEAAWATFDKITNRDRLAFARELSQLGELARYDDDALWQAIESVRSGDADDDGSDLLGPEWALLSAPDDVDNGPDFKLRAVDVPLGFNEAITCVVRVERLRAVTALLGFTRIDSPRDWGDTGRLPGERRVALARRPPAFVPAAEVRGEGIFVRLNEDRIAEWMDAHGRHAERFMEAHRRWREVRGIEPAEADFPGLRYVLLHSLSHALMREVALECGYPAASIRERIYSREPSDGEPMAGVLIYTAAPDAEGTLGGLVRLAEPEHFGRILRRALDALRFCTSDPLCAEHDLSELDQAASLHAAACHACLFAPETSCERSNQYLDRAILVETLHAPGLAFFCDERDAR